MSKKYKGVFRDSKGRIYCQTEFKASATGKRQRFKRYRNMWGNLLKVKKKPMTSFVELGLNFMISSITRIII